MATEGKGYRALKRQVAEIRARVEAKKHVGEKTYERQQRPQHTFEPIYMADVITNRGRRYFSAQRCTECDHVVTRGEMTYDPIPDVPVIRYQPAKPDPGCKKRLDTRSKLP